MIKILICGLPGSGKTTLAESLSKELDAIWINADKVRTRFQDWDFSAEARIRQANRMRCIADGVIAAGRIAVVDFVCPTEETRNIFDPDILIWLDTIKEGRFEDTNKVFQRPVATDYNVQEQRGDVDAKIIAYEIGQRFIWNNQAPTTQMLGRFQPWHPGHQALFDRAMAKHEQVVLMVRDMPTDDSNPYPAHEVIENLQQSLCEFAGKVKIEVVPNILNITYGRGVGYKIEQEVFDDATHDISATKIREQMRKEGKL